MLQQQLTRILATVLLASLSLPAQFPAKTWPKSVGVPAPPPVDPGGGAPPSFVGVLAGLPLVLEAVFTGSCDVLPASGPLRPTVDVVVHANAAAPSTATTIPKKSGE